MPSVNRQTHKDVSKYMKKLALTNLIVLIAIKSVSACDYDPRYGPPTNIIQGNENYFWAMFIGSFVLFIPLVIIYFLRKHRGLWTILLSMTSFVLFFPALFFAAFAFMCSDGTPIAAVIIGEFFWMCLLFTIQLSSWISERDKNLT